MSEYKFYWQDTHVENLDTAQEIAKEFTWKIWIGKREDEWFVLDGEAKVFSSTDKAVIEAFLYGLALAYQCIPEPYYSQLKKDLTDWIDSL